MKFNKSSAYLCNFKPVSYFYLNCKSFLLLMHLNFTVYYLFLCSTFLEGLFDIKKNWCLFLSSFNLCFIYSYNLFLEGFFCWTLLYVTPYVNMVSSICLATFNLISESFILIHLYVTLLNLIEIFLLFCHTDAALSYRVALSQINFPLFCLFITTPPALHHIRNRSSCYDTNVE